MRQYKFKWCSTSCSMTQVMMNGTTLGVDLNLLNTLKQAILNHLLFLKQKNELIHYQTKLQQYHSIFQNLQLYIFFLEIFEDHLRTNNQNPLFIILAIFSNTSSSIRISFVFLLRKISKGTPHTLCLDTHQSG